MRCTSSRSTSSTSASIASTASALLRWTGRTYADDADTEAAFDCYAAALAVAMANSDRPGVASVVNLMAIAHQQRGDLDEAARLYGRAVKYATLAGETQLVAMIEQNLGTIAGIRGDQPKALTHYRAALAGYRRLGLDAPLCGLLNNIGMLYSQMRRWRSAEEMYLRGVRHRAAHRRRRHADRGGGEPGRTLHRAARLRDRRANGATRRSCSPSRRATSARWATRTSTTA